MPYVTRNTTGAIVGLMQEPPSDSATNPELIDADDPQIAAFLGGAGGTDFGRLDADFVRVLEDVIDTLIIKNVINITDLPEQAQAKLFARKSFRERITRHSLRLFGDSGAGDVIGDTQFGGLA